jgi:homogentisate 1,2-dioxygenase
MSAHGPDAGTHQKASNAELKPAKVGEGSMAFMFESCLMIGVTEWGLKQCKKVQEDYNEESWTPLKAHFKFPNGARRVSNLVGDADGSAGIDIDKSVNGKEATVR